MVLSLQGVHEAGLPGHESAAQEAGGEDQGHGPQEGGAAGAPGHGLHIQQVSPFLSLAVSLFLSLSHTHASRPLLFHLGISGSGTVSHISVISSPAEFYFERGVVLGEGFVYMKIRMKGLERGVSKRADP